MATTKKIIQLELNEISYDVIDAMIAQGELPNFEKVRENWDYRATSSETDYEKLEPWIQWVTAHTGKTFAEHNIFRLSDSEKLECSQIWEVLSDAGLESGIIGSMNATRGRTTGGTFMPDPWAKNNTSYPANLKPIWSLISNRVQGHATQPLTTKALISGATKLLGFNLPPKLYASIIAQLYTQKLDPLKQWKLAGRFDQLLYEIFATIYKRTDYTYYTLFLNAVAHYQHHYWRAFDITPFSKSIQYNNIGPQDDPVRFGYKLYDEIIGKVIATAGPGVDIIIASGLSQVPYIEKEDQGGMNYYRLKDHKLFARTLGLLDSNNEVFPLMSRDWQISFTSPEQRQNILAVLQQLTIDDRPLFAIKETTPGFIFIETNYSHVMSESTMIAGFADGQPQAFGEHFTNIAIKSGHHSGIGNLWYSNPDFVSNPDPVIPLTDLYGHTLSALGVAHA